MAAGRGDLQSPACLRLPDDVRQVGYLRVGDRARRRRLLQLDLTLEPGHQIAQAGRARDLQAVHQRGLEQRLGRDDGPPVARRPRGQQARQHAPDRADTAVQRQLAEQHGAEQAGRRNGTDGGQHGRRDPEVVAGAHLRQIRRGQPERHLAVRPRLPRVPDRRSHAVLRLAQPGVRQPDQRDPA